MDTDAEVPWVIEWHDQVESTNDVARHRAAAGAPHGTVVVAATQSGGRGRGENGWVSPPGGLYASILLRDLPEPMRALLPLATAAATAEALADAVPGLPVWIKWPNDLLAASVGAPAPAGKVGGILVETSYAGDRLEHAVVGLGLNLRCTPEALPTGTEPPALALGSCHTSAPPPEEFIDPLLDMLVATLGRDPSTVLASVEARMAYQGRLVSCRARGATGGEWSGTIEGLTPTGALRLATAQGPVTLHAWDVEHLRLRDPLA